MRRWLIAVSAVALLYAQSWPTAQQQKLQIHFMDVGQGDGAILIAPNGETVLFDNGPANGCSRPLNYLQSLKITKIDYEIISHYHADHFGCTAQVLARFPLQRFSFDRGGSYPGAVYDGYVRAVGAKRRTVTDGQVITLDPTAPNPVTITIKALNGNGVSTDNENDESVSALVSFGTFRAEIGGDLSGVQAENYQDIESSVAPKVGQVDVYKVHHHGSRFSTNTTWLQVVHPRVGIVSAGNGNGYGHPTQECIERLHTAGVKTYWTERGNGVPPELGLDTVAGTAVVEVSAQATTVYTVRSTAAGGRTDTYQTWLAASAPPPVNRAATYAWSKRSNLYHVATCRFVANIRPEHLETGPVPPVGKTLHKDCPQ